MNDLKKSLILALKSNNIIIISKITLIMCNFAMITKLATNYFPDNYQINIIPVFEKRNFMTFLHL